MPTEYHKKIILPVPTANLTDFPVCVKIVADTDIGAACREDGYDIHFKAGNGVTELKFERESFAVAGGEATGIFWVKSDVATAGTYIWCYYGNAAAGDVSSSLGRWTVTGGCAFTSPTQVQKTGGTPGQWTSQLYSGLGYVDACAVLFRAGQTNKDLMVGLNSDPATDANYLSLDYAILPEVDGNIYFYVNGAYVASDGAYDTNTILSITYDGVNVEYYVGGVLKHTVARAVGAALYADSSFREIGTTINYPCFGPSVAWVNYEYDNQVAADGGLTWGAEEIKNVMGSISTGLWLGV